MYSVYVFTSAWVAGASQPGSKQPKNCLSLQPQVVGLIL